MFEVNSFSSQIETNFEQNLQKDSVKIAQKTQIENAKYLLSLASDIFNDIGMPENSRMVESIFKNPGAFSEMFKSPTEKLTKMILERNDLEGSLRELKRLSEKEKHNLLKIENEIYSTKDLLKKKNKDIDSFKKKHKL